MPKKTADEPQSTVEKHAGGRPLVFKTPEDLSEKIEEYFTYCDAKTKEIHSEKLGDMIVPDPEPYTLSGLAVWLGVDRKTLLNYSERDEFFPTIKQARARVEADLERRLSHKDTFTTGLIFNAKNNFGWVDTPTTVQQINVGSDKGNAITFVDFKHEPKSQ